MMRKLAEILGVALLAAALGIWAPQVSAQFVGYFTANLPLIGDPSGNGNLAQGTKSGNTTKFATVQAVTPASGNCAQWDASGNIDTTGLPCAPQPIANPASLSIQNQSLTGGANVTSIPLSTGNVTVNCGLGPLQFITNNGTFTMTAPVNDGSCIVLVTNGASAGAISFSGFNVSSTATVALDTVNGHKFSIQIWRINATAGFAVVPNQ